MEMVSFPECSTTQHRVNFKSSTASDQMGASGFNCATVTLTANVEIGRRSQTEEENRAWLYCRVE